MNVVRVLLCLPLWYAANTVEADVDCSDITNMYFQYSTGCFVLLQQESIDRALVPKGDGSYYFNRDAARYECQEKYGAWLFGYVSEAYVLAVYNLSLLAVGKDAPTFISVGMSKVQKNAEGKITTYTWDDGSDEARNDNSYPEWEDAPNTDHPPFLQRQDSGKWLYVTPKEKDVVSGPVTIACYRTKTKTTGFTTPTTKHPETQPPEPATTSASNNTRPIPLFTLFAAVVLAWLVMAADAAS